MALGIFEVHAGDFKPGRNSQLAGRNLLMGTGRGHWFREKISLSQIAELEVASQESVNKLGGAIGWGIAGDVLFGPVGLLAGLLRGGRGNRVTFVCKLKDGRKFLATAPSSVFSQIRMGFATSEFGGSPKAVTRQDATHSEDTTLPNLDRQKWNALLLYDNDIASSAERIRSLGPKWMDELASAYLTLNDKEYLPNIVEGILERARLERKKEMTVTINGKVENSADVMGHARNTDMKLCPSCRRWLHQTATRCTHCGTSPSSKATKGDGSKIKAFAIAGYAIFFGLGGIAEVFEGEFLAGFLFLASVIVALPISAHFVEQRWNFAMPSWARATSALALLVAAGMALPSTNSSAPTPKTTTASSTAPASGATDLSKPDSSAPATSAASGHPIANNIDHAFEACLASKGKTGQYSSFDGGHSATLLMADACHDEWKAYVDQCIQSGETDGNCTLKSAILAQAALKLLNK